MFCSSAFDWNSVILIGLVQKWVIFYVETGLNFLNFTAAIYANPKCPALPISRGSKGPVTDLTCDYASVSDANGQDADQVCH